MTRIHTPVSVPFSNRDEWMKLRGNTLGSSEAPALFDAVVTENPVTVDDQEDPNEVFEEDGQSASPYASVLSLWALKTGRITPSKSTNNRVNWGIAFEDKIANVIANQEGWGLREPQGYYLHPTVPRMGASLDREICIDDDGVWLPFEIKNVADNQRWKWKNAVNEWVIPPHILIQVQHQLAVTGLPKAYIGVLFGGNEDRVFEVPRDDEIIAEIEAAVGEFWWHVDNNVQPTPNFDRDAQVLRRLNMTIDPVEVLDWTQDDDKKLMVADMKNHAAQANAHKKEADKIRTVLSVSLGTAAAAKIDDQTLLKASIIEGTTFTVTREAYRKIGVTKAPVKHSGRPIAQLLSNDTP